MKYGTLYGLIERHHPLPFCSRYLEANFASLPWSTYFSSPEFINLLNSLTKGSFPYTYSFLDSSLNLNVHIRTDFIAFSKLLLIFFRNLLIHFVSSLIYFSKLSPVDISSSDSLVFVSSPSQLKNKKSRIVPSTSSNKNRFYFVHTTSTNKPSESLNLTYFIDYFLRKEPYFFFSFSYVNIIHVFKSYVKSIFALIHFIRSCGFTDIFSAPLHIIFQTFLVDLPSLLILQYSLDSFISDHKYPNLFLWFHFTNLPHHVHSFILSIPFHLLLK